MPKLSQDIFAVPDGELHPRWFRAGDDVTGAVADAAKDQGKLEHARKAPANKALRQPEVKGRE